MATAPTPRPRALRLYGAPSELPAPSWAWVERHLIEAGIYWVDACVRGRPHPRPVWGVWLGQGGGGRLHLSIGSPGLRQAAAAGAELVVHLDSGTDVVLVEGHGLAGAGADDAAVAAYDAKYDWTYDLDAYGPFSVLLPDRVLAWRTAGPHGRDSFRQTGCWTFPTD